ncbi:MAG: hypothetical protein LBH87_02875 [Coriobacteriales bacterium]|jgi:DNA-binding transcriptional regulator/RsmH inhibitor MraZ|nr:hypothetical protein [Coriobacteriales bacterium]
MISGLRGTSVNPIDTKGRVSLPTNFRKKLEESELSLVKWIDNGMPQLRLYRSEDYDEFIDKWFEEQGGRKVSNLEHERMGLQFEFSSVMVSLDSSHRIRISQKMRDYAGITDHVIFIGGRSFVSLFGDAASEILSGVQLYDEDGQPAAQKANQKAAQFLPVQPQVSDPDDE